MLVIFGIVMLPLSVHSYSLLLFTFTNVYI